MIDINKMRLLVQDYKLAGSPVFVQAADMNELLNRLEVAEKDIALKDKIIDSLGSTLNAVSNERDALRAELAQLHKEADKFDDGIDWIQRALQAEAKVEAMEKQEPVAWCATDETGTVVEALGMNQSSRFDAALYLAPSAQPKLNEIKIALHRALELGRRETWTGAKKYCSRENQCEEQQCWDKVWTLLGAEGEEK